MNHNKENIIFPNYNNSVLNLISTILFSLGIKPNHNTLRQINLNELKSKKNIVLILFDGLGYNFLKKYSVKNPDSILNKHLLDKITSVFPSTTTAAITSLLTEKTPHEHGSIGWNLFFKEYGKFINILPWQDGITNEALNTKYYKLSSIFDHENIFARIKRETSNDNSVDTFYLSPSEIADSHYAKKMTFPAKILPYKDETAMFKNIEKLIIKKNEKNNDINDNNRKFIYAYSLYPDKYAHSKGIENIDTRELMSTIEKQLKNLIKSLTGTDTTIFITSDHGMIDISKTIDINIEDEKLYNSLLLPTFPEGRFLSFHLNNKSQVSIDYIKERYGEDFLIYSKEEFFKNELLGTGKKHKKIDDFLGDIVLIGKSNKLISTTLLQQIEEKSLFDFKAAHSGLTEDEMLVPLIQINT